MGCVTVHAEEVVGYREQMEKFDNDLKFMDEESGMLYVS